MRRTVYVLQCETHAAAAQLEPNRPESVAAFRRWVAYQVLQHAIRFPLCEGMLVLSAGDAVKR